MKKILTLLLILIAAVCTAFAFGACNLGDVFGGNNSDGTSENSPSDGDNTTDGGNGNSGGNTSESGSATNGGNTSEGGNGSSDGNTSEGGTSGGSSSGTGGNVFESGSSGGGTPHVCSFTYTSTVAPDCLNTGYDLYSCTCGQTQQSNFVGALGHNLVWTVTSAATCTSDGSERGVCSRCSASFTRTINKTAHTYGAYTSNNDATCTADGTETARCTVCGNRDTRNVPNSALPHTYGTYTYNNDATCAADGTESANCTVCGNRDTQTVAGTQLCHSFCHLYDYTDFRDFQQSAAIIAAITSCRNCGMPLSSVPMNNATYRFSFYEVSGDDFGDVYLEFSNLTFTTYTDSKGNPYDALTSFDLYLLQSYTDANGNAVNNRTLLTNTIDGFQITLWDITTGSNVTFDGLVDNDLCGSGANETMIFHFYVWNGQQSMHRCFCVRF